MLQNRVDPFGNIIKTSARGGWMGNRGLLHDAGQVLVRQYRSKAWITCLLQFRGIRRKVMTPGLYTELFFWDEATAFAAGHRPCAECRRQDFLRFKMAWLAGNPQYGFDAKVHIAEIDEVIHRERIDMDGLKVIHAESPAVLPDGVFIVYKDTPCLVDRGGFRPWSPGGYGEPVEIPSASMVSVLTPASVVNALRAGYLPQLNLV